jgi:hypothetical protein
MSEAVWPWLGSWEVFSSCACSRVLCNPTRAAWGCCSGNASMLVFGVQGSSSKQIPSRTWCVGCMGPCQRSGSNQSSSWSLCAAWMGVCMCG